MDLIKSLAHKYSHIMAYLFFGVCTTGVNVMTYYICYHICHILNVPSTIIAWVFAVVFAYLTNKLFVFNSKSFDWKLLKREILSFFGCRLLTGILDVTVMFLTVDVLQRNDTLWKLLSNLIVIILNYWASKLVIFRNPIIKTGNSKGMD